MTSFKKFINTFLVILVFAIMIATIVCCFKFGVEQVKVFYENCYELLNKPLPVVGISTLMVCIFIKTIFDNTSLGKVRFNEVIRDFKANKEDTKKYCDEQNEKIQLGLDEINVFKNELKEYKCQLDFYKNQLLDACKSINNVKVKEIARKLEIYEEAKNNETIEN